MDFSSFIPLAMNVFGTAMQAGGESAAGESALTQAKYVADQLRVNAGQAKAASQVDAANEIRKSKLLQSRALALAAASGGGAVDPTVMKIISGLAGEGKLASLTQLYSGEERARGMMNQAAATEYEGELKKAAYDLKATGTILSGAKSIYDTLGPMFKTPGTADAGAPMPGSASDYGWGITGSSDYVGSTESYQGGSLYWDA